MPRWVPNAITLLRIVLIPIWWIEAEAFADATYYGGEADRHRFLAVLALVAIGVSDVVDGFIARRFGLATKAGAVLDAVADKLAQVVLLVFFTFFGGVAFEPVPLGFFVLIIARDVVLATGTLLVRAKHGSVAVVHEWHGKLSSLLFFVLLLALTYGVSPGWIRGAIWAITVLIVASTLRYVHNGWVQWRNQVPTD